MQQWQILTFLLLVEAVAVLLVVVLRDRLAAWWLNRWQRGGVPRSRAHANRLVDVHRRAVWLEEKSVDDTGLNVEAIAGAVAHLKQAAAHFVREPDCAMRHGESLLACCEQLALAFEEHVAYVERMRDEQGTSGNGEPPEEAISAVQQLAIGLTQGELDTLMQEAEAGGGAGEPGSPDAGEPPIWDRNPLSAWDAIAKEKE